ncbi:MAG TPA: hypothetical protein VMP08_26065 [Anaerolineae bacterium]|nr:hypothetical protein [Anaerolineae bacterium]
MSRKLTDTIQVYLEIGRQRTFVAALNWPGWCRAGRDETAALQALLEYGPRYARVLQPARLGFQVPDNVSAFVVAERLKGSTTTDFGAPGLVPTSDAQPLDSDELRRLQAILKACWRAFDATVESATGKSLRTGPRGGGRALDGIVEHVLGAEQGYLSSLGGKAPQPEGSPLSTEPIRQAILKTLIASAHGEIPERGPRGGKRWSPQYFVRRDAWHVLDHMWEIEDRQVA